MCQPQVGSWLIDLRLEVRSLPWGITSPLALQVELRCTRQFRYLSQPHIRCHVEVGPYEQLSWARRGHWRGKVSWQRENFLGREQGWPTWLVILNFCCFQIKLHVTSDICRVQSMEAMLRILEIFLCRQIKKESIVQKDHPFLFCKGKNAANNYDQPLVEEEAQDFGGARTHTAIPIISFDL